MLIIYNYYCNHYYYYHTGKQKDKQVSNLNSRLEERKKIKEEKMKQVKYRDKWNP